MRIGELADASGIPTRTIRFYERRGLIPPPNREANGYRSYDQRFPARLEFIRSAQAAGLTLSEISDVLELRDDGTAPCEHVDRLLRAKLVDVRERRASLERTEIELAGLIERSAHLDPADCTDRDICQILQPRQPGT